MSLVLERRVVDPLAPKNAANHLSVVYLSVLEEHSAVVFQCALEKVAAVELFISVDKAESAWSSFFVNETDVTRGDTIFDLLNVVEHDESFAIDDVSADQLQQFLGFDEGRRFHELPLLNVINGQ